MITLLSTILTVIGGINWLLVGTFEFDLVAWIFGSSTAVGSRIVYIIIGIAAVWLLISTILRSVRGHKITSV